MNAPATSPTPATAKVKLPIGLVIAVLVMIGILLLPLPADLPVAGHRMLAILAFAVVVWITEAVSYEASAIMITSLMAFLIGMAPTLADPSKLYGTSAGITMALTGFSNAALALVAGALFIAAAMTHTGLDRRIALVTLSRIGTSTRRILLGETEGFEPSMRLYTPYSLSRGAPSATRSRFQSSYYASFSRRFWQSQAAGWSSSNALCRLRTASSMYFSSMTTEVLISEVEIIWMLMPSSLKVRNILLATPTWLRMPMPTMLTLQILVSPATSCAPSSGSTFSLSSSTVRT